MEINNRTVRLLSQTNNFTDENLWSFFEENFDLKLKSKQFLLKNLYWIEKKKLAWRMNLDVIAQNIQEVLTEIKTENSLTKTLFIRGELSNYILEEDISEIRKALPNSIVSTIKNVGHWLHAENPIEFYKIVTTFISEE